MSRRADLEKNIRESYALIREYESQVPTLSDPKEKSRTQREMNSQWSFIERYWNEYNRLVKNDVPADIAEITARFSNTQKAPQVFLAYACIDTKRVEELYQQLKEYGLVPWMDKHDLLPGQKREQEIDRSIHASKFFLACFSEHSADANHLSKELQLVLEAYEQMSAGQVYFIPIRLDDVRLPDFSVGTVSLRDLQWVDLFDPDGFDRLLRVLLPKQGLVEIGNDFFFKANHDLAIDAYRKAIKYNSQDVHAWYYMGLAYMEGKNDLKRARIAFRKAVELEPGFHEAWYHLGCAYEGYPGVGRPAVYHQTSPGLVQRAVHLVNATPSGGLIALRAATGSTFYKIFRKPLLEALERGVSVQIMLCHIQNRHALEVRSRCLVGDDSMVRVIQAQLQDSAFIIDEIARMADGYPGKLTVRAYNDPIQIECAVTIILPKPGQEEDGEERDLAGGVLFYVPYTNKLGSHEIVYEFPSTAVDLEGNQLSPFLHYYQGYYAVWNHRSTLAVDLWAWQTELFFG